MTWGVWVTIMLIGAIGALFGHSFTALWYSRRAPDCALQPITVQVVRRPPRIDWDRLEAARDPHRIPVGTWVVGRDLGQAYADRVFRPVVLSDADEKMVAGMLGEINRP